MKDKFYELGWYFMRARINGEWRITLVSPEVSEGDGHYSPSVVLEIWNKETTKKLRDALNELLDEVS
jgi:hypothetical protein